MIGLARPVTFVNARVVVPGGVASRLRFASRILSIEEPPRAGDAVVDLEGAFVLPGLINAHDHLELNHYGALKPRDRYENATDWIEDLRPVLQTDPVVRRKMAYPLSARLFIGGLKNLLSGVTTVAHHNPRYQEIRPSFPVRVVKKYGWAHSFFLEGRPVGARGERGENVRTACLATPPDRPFIVHAGEGVDGRAASELTRLEELGCLRDNTVLVHGVAFTAADWPRVLGRAASLVWCPASNTFLFGRTAPVREFLDSSADASAHVCLGTDSRVTGANDMLEELRAARRIGGLSPAELLRAATTTAARVLKLAGSGRIAVDAPADMLVIPPTRDEPAEALLATTRGNITLVVVGGRPAVGSPAMRAVFRARRAGARPIVVDESDRLAASHLAAAIARSPIREPGVECR